MKKPPKPALLVITFALGACAGAGGDSMRDEVDPGTPAAGTLAAWTDIALHLDGRLDEPVWQQTPVHTLRLREDRARPHGPTPEERGTVRFARGRTHFYAAFEFTDRDVVQENDEDQQHHFRTGDVAELFLKPAGASHYWELYATPNGRKTAFFFPGRGRMGLASNLTCQSGIDVAAQIRGSLNDWRDDDEGWTAEMAIPLEALAAAGVPLDPQHSWTVLAGRYNYGRHLQTMGPELSSFPGLRHTSFHLHEEFAPLWLGNPLGLDRTTP